MSGLRPEQQHRHGMRVAFDDVFGHVFRSSFITRQNGVIAAKLSVEP